MEDNIRLMHMALLLSGCYQCVWCNNLPIAAVSRCVGMPHPSLASSWSPDISLIL